jgi:signal peptidase I
MLTRERTELAPPGLRRSRGWPEVRFWVGTLGVFVTTLVFALISVTFLLALIFGYRPVVVISGSMEPAISFGDVVLYRQQGIDGIGPGSVVIFDDPAAEDGTVIHRVVGVDPVTGNLRTKGDMNPQADSNVVTAETIDGVGRLLVPYVGLPAAWMQTGRPILAVAFIVLAVLAAWTARWGWNTRFDPWAGEAVDQPAS